MAEKSSLQQAREAAGLTVEQISAITNIRAGVIRDLENNSVEICGGIAYARGHVRSIAKAINSKTGKAINIDADVLVSELEASQSTDSKKIIEKLAENNVADKPKEKKRMKFGTLASISATVLSIGFIAQVAINNVSSISDGVTAVSVKKPSAQESTSQINLPAGVNLVLTGVYGKSWVGISNLDGQVIFNGQITEEQVVTFNDPKVLKVVIGNAGAVKLNLNGTDLGVAGADGEVVRLDFDENGQL
jgi:transcriptional regulator with XRE-family HTH domain